MGTSKKKRTTHEQVLHDLSNMTVFWISAAGVTVALTVVAAGYIVVKVLPVVAAYLQTR